MSPLLLTLTVSILKKKLLTTPNMSQGITKSHSPLKKLREDASVMKESLFPLKTFLSASFDSSAEEGHDSYQQLGTHQRYSSHARPV